MGTGDHVSKTHSIHHFSFGDIEVDQEKGLGHETVRVQLSGENRWRHGMITFDHTLFIQDNLNIETQTIVEIISSLSTFSPTEKQHHHPNHNTTSDKALTTAPMISTITDDQVRIHFGLCGLQLYGGGHCISRSSVRTPVPIEPTQTKGGPGPMARPNDLLQNTLVDSQDTPTNDATKQPVPMIPELPPNPVPETRIFTSDMDPEKVISPHQPDQNQDIQNVEQLSQFIRRQSNNPETTKYVSIAIQIISACQRTPDLKMSVISELSVLAKTSISEINVQILKAVINYWDQTTNVSKEDALLTLSTALSWTYPSSIDDALWTSLMNLLSKEISLLGEVNVEKNRICVSLICDIISMLIFCNPSRIPELFKDSIRPIVSKSLASQDYRIVAFSSLLAESIDVKISDPAQSPLPYQKNVSGICMGLGSVTRFVPSSTITAMTKEKNSLSLYLKAHPDIDVWLVDLKKSLFYLFTFQFALFEKYVFYECKSRESLFYCSNIVLNLGDMIETLEDESISSSFASFLSIMVLKPSFWIDTAPFRTFVLHLIYDLSIHKCQKISQPVSKVLDGIKGTAEQDKTVAELLEQVLNKEPMIWSPRLRKTSLTDDICLRYINMGPFDLQLSSVIDKLAAFQLADNQAQTSIPAELIHLKKMSATDAVNAVISFLQSDSKHMLVRGPPGSGKSTLVGKLFEKFILEWQPGHYFPMIVDYNYLEMDPNSSFDTLIKYMFKILSTKFKLDVSEIVSDTTKGKYFLIILDQDGAFLRNIWPELSDTFQGFDYKVALFTNDTYDSRESLNGLRANNSYTHADFDIEQTFFMRPWNGEMLLRHYKAYQKSGINLIQDADESSLRGMAMLDGLQKVVNTPLHSVIAISALSLIKSREKKESEKDYQFLHPFHCYDLHQEFFFDIKYSNIIKTGKNTSYCSKEAFLSVQKDRSKIFAYVVTSSQSASFQFFQLTEPESEARDSKLTFVFDSRIGTENAPRNPCLQVSGNAGLIDELEKLLMLKARPDGNMDFIHPKLKAYYLALLVHGLVMRNVVSDHENVLTEFGMYERIARFWKFKKAEAKASVPVVLASVVENDSAKDLEEKPANAPENQTEDKKTDSEVEKKSEETKVGDFEEKKSEEIKIENSEEKKSDANEEEKKFDEAKQEKAHSDEDTAPNEKKEEEKEPVIEIQVTEPKAEETKQPISTKIAEAPSSVGGYLILADTFKISELKMIAERAKIDKNFQNRLFELVLLSKNNEEVETVSSNAITILNYSGFSFQGKNLSEIRIPKADLSGANLHKTDFSQASLCSVNFENAFIQECNFFNANLDGARFSQTRQIKVHNTKINCLCPFKSVFGVWCIASGTSEKDIIVWDLETGETVTTLSAHVGEVSVIKHLVGPNEQSCLLSGSRDCVVHLWDVASSSPTLSFVGHSGPVTDISLEASIAPSTRFCSGSIDGSIKIWNLSSNTEIHSIEAHEGGVMCVNWYESQGTGTFIASVGSDKKLTIWNSSDFSLFKSMELESVPRQLSVIHSLSKSPEKTNDSFDDLVYAITVEENGQVTKWNISNQTKSADFTIPLSKKSPIAILSSKDSSLYGLVKDADEAIHIYDIQRKTRATTLLTSSQEISCYEKIQTNDASVLFMAGKVDGSVEFWYRFDDNILDSLIHPNPQITSYTIVSINETDTILILGYENGSVSLFDAESGFELNNIKLCDAQITHLTPCCLEEDKSLVIAVENGGAFKLDLKTKEHKQVIHELPKKIVFISVLRPSRRTNSDAPASTSGMVIFVDIDGSITLYNSQDWTTIECKENVINNVTCCALADSTFPSDLLALGSASGKVCLWDIHKREVKSITDAHQSAVQAMVFSRGPDLEFILVTGGVDGIIQVREVEEFKAIHTFSTNRTSVKGLCTFETLDGDRIVVASFADSTIAMFSLCKKLALYGIQFNKSRSFSLAAYVPNSKALPCIVACAPSQVLVFRVDAEPSIDSFALVEENPGGEGITKLGETAADLDKSRQGGNKKMITSPSLATMTQDPSRLGHAPEGSHGREEWQMNLMWRAGTCDLQAVDCAVHNAQNVTKSNASVLMWEGGIVGESLLKGFCRHRESSTIGQCLVLAMRPERGSTDANSEEYTRDLFNRIAECAIKGDPIALNWLIRGVKLGSMRVCQILSQVMSSKESSADPTGYLELADFFFKGKNGESDLNESAKWLWKAVECRSEYARKVIRQLANRRLSVFQRLLGEMYAKGIGIEEANMELAVNMFQQAAEQGDAESHFRLGQIYANGDGVEQDPAESMRHYTAAAESGHCGAQYALGQIYFIGEGGVDVDLATALIWFTKSADQNHAPSQKAIGDIYNTGDATDQEEDQEGRIQQNSAEALRWYLRAAEQNLADAQFAAGSVYYSGFPAEEMPEESEGDASGAVQQDLDQAFIWIEKAAKQNHAEAQYYLGNMYYSGEGVDPDLKLALEWYLKAAEQNNADAQYLAGMMLGSGEGSDDETPNPKAAAVWYEKAAAQDHVDAMCSLAMLYLSPDDAANEEGDQDQDQDQSSQIKRDPQVAIDWYTKAGDLECAYAWTALGNMYRDGDGVDPDYDRAVDYYTRAADLGDPDGQVALAQCCEQGIGLDVDLDRAREWYEKAAEQSHAEALYSVGRFYEAALGGLDEDPEKAQEYFQAAADQGHEEAAAALERF